MYFDSIPEDTREKVQNVALWGAMVVTPTAGSLIWLSLLLVVW